MCAIGELVGVGLYPLPELGIEELMPVKKSLNTLCIIFMCSIIIAYIMHR